MSRATLADLYRPQTFDQVYGQDSVVTCLSGLIQRGQLGRDILLHGSVGSGKTSLAWIYAKALNCEQPRPDGSPCLACETCRDCERPGPNGEACGGCGPCRKKDGQVVAGLHPYNVSRRGGGREAVTAWTEPRARSLPRTRYKILFFDEAQALKPEACDALLELVELAEGRVLFFFATTEAAKIRPALRSRLFDLLVRPLTPERAVRFLQDRAYEAELDFEPEALALLAGLRGGYPRNLLLGLDRVYEPGTRLTVAQVRAAFDIDQTEPLLAYVQALAAGDLAAQTTCMADWHESVAEKVSWLQAFLLSLYANDVLYRHLMVDGLIDAISDSTRAPILDGFCRRLSLAHHADLEPAFRRMMEFWSSPVDGHDKPGRAGDVALSLRVALFHHLVNEDLVALDGSGVPPQAPSLASNEVDPITPPHGFMTPTPIRSDQGLADEDPAYLTVADARTIANRASFLTQEHGVLFNALFEMRPALLGAAAQADSIALIRAFGDDLGAQVPIWGGALFAGLTLVLREGSEVYGRLVAYLPRPARGNSGVDCIARAAEWHRGWGTRNTAGAAHAVTLFTAGVTDAAALAFHWDHVLSLCAGLDTTVEEWHPKARVHAPLVSLLGVRPRRALGPIIAHPLLQVSEHLTDKAVALASRNQMVPLSAFDDRAWDELRCGWELWEFEDRRRTKQAREARLLTLCARHGPESPEVRDLTRRWRADPHERPRTWSTWW